MRMFLILVVLHCVTIAIIFLKPQQVSCIDLGAYEQALTGLGGVEP